MPDREKAIRILEGNYKSFVLRHNGELLTVNELIALLKAQEPCKDAVSRKDVINVLQSPCDMRYVNGNWHPCIGDYIEAITNLSAVAPKAQEPKQMRCEDCGYAFTEGFVHERLVCEKHQEIEISDDWYCADFWKE